MPGSAARGYWIVSSEFQVPGSVTKEDATREPPAGPGDCPTAPRPSPTRINRWLRWLIGVSASLLVLGVTLLLTRDWLIQRYLVTAIHRRTGMTARLTGFETGLRTPMLRVTGFTLHDAPEFGGALCLEVPEIFFMADPAATEAGKLRFKEIRFHLASLHLVRNRDGKLNLEVLEKLGPWPHFKYEFAGVDRCQLTLGKVTFMDLAKTNRPLEFDLSLREEVSTNLASIIEVKRWLGGLALRVATQQWLKNPGNAEQSGWQKLPDLFR